MEILMAYRVLTDSTSHCAKVGDVVWLSENGDLVNANAGGWLSKDEYEIDFEYEIANDYYLMPFCGSELLVYTGSGENPLKKN